MYNSVRELYRSPRRLHTRTRLSSFPKTNRDSSLNTTFYQSVTFHIDLAWHHCKRSCRRSCSQQFLTAHSERSTWPETRRIDQPEVFIPMIRPLSNSLNCEKCLLARLPGMFCLPKSSYNRRVIVTFMNLRIFAGLYSTLFLIVAPPRRV
ncbi:uncharacterized protein TNCV_3534691 [Trichonephila clavipes]|nr:uncharacterized protein TNCV_3534691 [Trichonephila clavipes]